MLLFTAISIWQVSVYRCVCFTCRGLCNLPALVKVKEFILEMVAPIRQNPSIWQYDKNKGQQRRPTVWRAVWAIMEGSYSCNLTYSVPNSWKTYRVSLWPCTVIPSLSPYQPQSMSCHLIWLLLIHCFLLSIIHM